MAYYGCNVKNEETKEKIRNYIAGLSKLANMDQGDFLLHVLQFYIEQKNINLNVR